MSSTSAETFSGPGRAARPGGGEAGAVWALGGRPRVVFGFTISEGEIVEIELLADPDRLDRLELAIVD
jgi:RNA polymerase sigma-70 factor, ECF subfamily